MKSREVPKVAVKPQPQQVALTALVDLYKHARDTHDQRMADKANRCLDILLEGFKRSLAGGKTIPGVAPTATGPLNKRPKRPSDG